MTARAAQARVAAREFIEASYLPDDQATAKWSEITGLSGDQVTPGLQLVLAGLVEMATKTAPSLRKKTHTLIKRITR